MKLRPLVSGLERRDFRDAYAAASGYEVPLEYLSSQQVFGCVRDDRLVGGFVLGTQTPFRTLNRIPEPARSEVAAQLDLDDTLELACLWLAPELRKGRHSVRFWLLFARAVTAQPRRAVVMGTEAAGLRRLYEGGGPTLLYDGPVTVDGKSTCGWIYTGPTRSFWPGVMRMFACKAFRPSGWRIARGLRQRPSPVGLEIRHA